MSDVKVTPYNEEAEQTLLGSMLISKEALAESLHLLKEHDFYSTKNQYVFNAIRSLAENQENVDLLMVSSYLKDHGQFKEIGGESYMAKLLELGSLSYHAKEHAQIIKEKSVRRSLLSASDLIKDVALTAPDGQSALHKAEEVIFEIASGKRVTGLVRVSETLEHITDELLDEDRDPNQVKGLMTGLVDLDHKLNGLKPGQLILVAARPSMGKSSLGMNIGQHVALRQKGNVCVFSLEMDAEQIIYRILSSETNVPLGDILKGNIEGKDRNKVLHGLNQLNNANLYIDETPGVNVMSMRSMLRRHKMEHGDIDLIIVDYLQLMEGSGGDNRQLEISGISRGLKSIAREFNCPLIAISQLSRAPELRSDRRPILSDLRESGAIEQDADVVIFIYRDDYYNENSEEPNVAEVKVAKQRNGETGTVKLAWLGQFTLFHNLIKQKETNHEY